MKAKALVLGLGAAALVATSVLPAQAQVVDDFLCSTFSFHCADPAPPPPAPMVAQEPAAAAEPVKKMKHHKKKAKMAQPKAAPAAAEPAPDAAPK